MKSKAFAFLMILMGRLVNAQTRVVYGSVKLFDTYPAEQVELYSKKAKASVATDSLGQFSIACMDKDVIQVKSKLLSGIAKRRMPAPNLLKLIFSLLIQIETEKLLWDMDM